MAPAPLKSGSSIQLLSCRTGTGSAAARPQLLAESLTQRPPDFTPNLWGLLCFLPAGQRGNGARAGTAERITPSHLMHALQPLLSWALGYFICNCGIFYPCQQGLEDLHCPCLCAMPQLKQTSCIFRPPCCGQELLTAPNLCAALREPPRAAQSCFLSPAQTQVWPSGQTEEPWKAPQCTRYGKARLSSFPHLPFSFSLLLPPPSQIVSCRPPRRKG